MTDLNIQDAVGVLTLDNGPNNSIHLDLLAELHETFNGVAADSSIKSLVIKSVRESVFSLGFDLPTLYHASEEDFKHFFRTFNQICIQLYSLPKPVIIAINGHAVAGGCVLALCGDQRLIADGKHKMGLNEVKLGVPVPYPCDRMLHELVGGQKAWQIIGSGDFYLPEEAHQLGMVDQLVDEDQLMTEALNIAMKLGNLPVGGYKAAKEFRTSVTLQTILATLPEKEEHFFRCWFAPETRKRLEKALEKFS